MEALEALITRRSTRNYRPDPVDPEKLVALTEKAFAGMEATEDTYASLKHSIAASKKGGYVFCYNAPVLIVVANRKDYGNNMADCACALENMMVAANALDLGSCWINQLKWLNEDETLLSMLREMGMKEDERVYGALAVGIADTEDALPCRARLPRTGNEVVYIR